MSEKTNSLNFLLLNNEKQYFTLLVSTTLDEVIKLHWSKKASDE